MRSLLMIAVIAALSPLPAHADDQARKVCMADARKLCAAQVRAWDRKGAELCLWQQIDKTSPACHQMILSVRAQRQAAANKR